MSLFFKDKKRTEEDDYNEDDLYQDEAEDILSGDSMNTNFSDTRSSGYQYPNNDPDPSGASGINMVIFKPLEYEQAQTIIDYLKKGKPIIVNLDEIDLNVAQRILDFISGAAYALEGTTRKAGKNIFVVVPASMSVENISDSDAASDVSD